MILSDLVIDSVPSGAAAPSAPAPSTPATSTPVAAAPPPVPNDLVLDGVPGAPPALPVDDLVVDSVPPTEAVNPHPYGSPPWMAAYADQQRINRENNAKRGA